MIVGFFRILVYYWVGWFRCPTKFTIVDPPLILMTINITKVSIQHDKENMTRTRKRFKLSIQIKEVHFWIQRTHPNFNWNHGNSVKLCRRSIHILEASSVTILRWKENFDLQVKWRLLFRQQLQKKNQGKRSRVVE